MVIFLQNRLDVRIIFTISFEGIDDKVKINKEILQFLPDTENTLIDPMKNEISSPVVFFSLII